MAFELQGPAFVQSNYIYRPAPRQNVTILLIEALAIFTLIKPLLKKFRRGETGRNAFKDSETSILVR
jgi:hypothetical protein